MENITNQECLQILNENYSRCGGELLIIFRLLHGLSSTTAGIKTIVELGVDKGGSCKLWSKLLDKDGLLIGVDCSPQNCKLDFSSFNCNVKFFPISNKDARESVIKELNGKEIDFLFIDAGHTYHEVRLDYEMYSPLVRDGGLIGFHDFGRAKDGVNKFVYELNVPNKVMLCKSDIAYIHKVKDFSEGWQKKWGIK